MCGRFTLTQADPATLAKTFALDALPTDLPPRYNVAPTQNIAVVFRDSDHQASNQFGWMRWGLVPSWAKDASGAAKAINARAETIADKPMFRAALSKRRCLVIADGFYELARQCR